MFLTKTFTAGNETYEEFPFLGELIMEAFLIENPNALNLGAKEFQKAIILGHQISLKKGSKNKEGRIDILAAYGNKMAIIELKKGQIDKKALEQLEKYLHNCSELESHEVDDVFRNKVVGFHGRTVQDYCNSINKNVQEIEWIGVLAGTSIEPSLAVELRDGYSFQKDDSTEGLKIGAITIKRFQGEKNRIYTITDAFFPEKVSNRDYSKYRIDINGDIRCTSLFKNHLALMLVKLYVEQRGNENVTVEELKNDIFPDSLQGTRTISRYEEAKDGRAFKATKDVITLANGKVCVSNQWSIDNIPKMITRAKELMPNINIQKTT